MARKPARQGGGATGSQTKLRKDIYERKYPETSRGAVGRAGYDEKSRQLGDSGNDSENKRFTAHTAAATGISERTIQMIEGKNAASTLDSIAAYARIVTKEVLLGEGNAAKILAALGNRHLQSAQATIAADGPGKDLLYRAINGFDLAE